MFDNRITELTELTAGGHPLPAPIAAIAQLEAYAAACGVLSFLDLETGEEVETHDDWNDFTSRFMEYALITGRNRSYCKLALAIATADGMDNTWDYYIELAQLLAAHYEEMHDLRLVRAQASFVAAGWQFTYFPDEFRWRAEIPGIEICGRTLSETFANITTYAVPALARWEEDGYPAKVEASS